MNNIEFTNFISSMLKSITTTQVLNILSGVVAVGMIFVLMWFGVRKITKQFTEMVAFGKWAITGNPKNWDKYDDIVSARETGKITNFTPGELREALITNSAYSEATMTKPKKNIDFGPKPIEPDEPHPERITPKRKKEAEDYYATHDCFGHKLGYDKRVWDNWYKKNANKYRKKYDKYKNYKRNYYYDSHGNKYYK